MHFFFFKLSQIADRVTVCCAIPHNIFVINGDTVETEEGAGWLDDIAITTIRRSSLYFSIC